MFYKCPRMSVGLMVSACPHLPTLDQATDRLWLHLGPPNFLELLRGFTSKFTTAFRGAQVVAMITGECPNI